MIGKLSCFQLMTDSVANRSFRGSWNRIYEINKLSAQRISDYLRTYYWENRIKSVTSCIENFINFENCWFTFCKISVKVLCSMQVITHKKIYMHHVKSCEKFFKDYSLRESISCVVIVDISIDCKVTPFHEHIWLLPGYLTLFNFVKVRFRKKENLCQGFLSRIFFNVKIMIVPESCNWQVYIKKRAWLVNSFVFMKFGQKLKISLDE